MKKKEIEEVTSRIKAMEGTDKNTSRELKRTQETYHTKLKKLEDKLEKENFHIEGLDKLFKNVENLINKPLRKQGYIVSPTQNKRNRSKNGLNKSQGMLLLLYTIFSIFCFYIY